jgi:hypothetical protein
VLADDPGLARPGRQAIVAADDDDPDARATAVGDGRGHVLASPSRGAITTTIATASASTAVASDSAAATHGSSASGCVNCASSARHARGPPVAADRVRADLQQAPRGVAIVEALDPRAQVREQRGTSSS